MFLDRRISRRYLSESLGGEREVWPRPLCRVCEAPEHSLIDLDFCLGILGQLFDTLKDGLPELTAGRHWGSTLGSLHPSLSRDPFAVSSLIDPQSTVGSISGYSEAQEFFGFSEVPNLVPGGQEGFRLLDQLDTGRKIDNVVYIDSDGQFPANIKTFVDVGLSQTNEKVRGSESFMKFFES